MSIEPDLLKEKNKSIKRESKFKKTRIIFMVLSFLVLAHFVWIVLPLLSPVEGKARSAEEAEIQVLSEGILKEVFVQNSDNVKAATLLFEFENEDLELELISTLQKKETLANDLERLKQTSSLAEKRLRSAKILYENGVITKHDLEAEELGRVNARDQFEAKRRDFESISFALESLEAKKDALMVKAPFGGIFLGDLAQRKNTYFKKGETLGILFNPKKFYLEAELSEDRMKHVRTGSTAKVSFKAIPRIFQGKVTQVDACVREAVEKVYKMKYVSRVLIELENPPTDLIPGMRGNAWFAVSHKEEINL